MCVLGFPTLLRFSPTLNILLWILRKIQSKMLKNQGKYSEKCNIYIKYFCQIKCYADRPYLVFTELKPETHIYIFWPNCMPKKIYSMLKDDVDNNRTWTGPFRLNNILDSLGLSNIWIHQTDIDIHFNLIKQRIFDTYKQSCILQLIIQIDWKCMRGTNMILKWKNILISSRKRNIKLH